MSSPCVRGPCPRVGGPQGQRWAASAPPWEAVCVGQLRLTRWRAVHRPEDGRPTATLGPVTQPCAPARHSATAPEAESCPRVCCDGAVSLPRACPAGGGNRHGPERGGKRQRRGLCARLPESTPGRSRRLLSLPAWRVAVKTTNPHVAPKGVLVLPRKRPTCPLSRTRQINLHFWTLSCLASFTRHNYFGIQAC